MALREDLRKAYADACEAGPCTPALGAANDLIIALNQEIERLQGEVDAVQAFRLTIEQTKAGELRADISSEFVHDLAALLADWFVQNGGINYVEMRCNHPDLGDMVLHLQRVEGKTPHELKAAAENTAQSYADESARYREEIANLCREGDDLQERLALAQATLQADEGRLRQAAEKAGVLYVGCDTPDTLADTVLGLKDNANIGAALLETLKANLPDYSWNTCPSEVVVYLLNQATDAQTDVARLVARLKADEEAWARRVAAQREKDEERARHQADRSKRWEETVERNRELEAAIAERDGAIVKLREALQRADGCIHDARMDTSEAAGMYDLEEAGKAIEAALTDTIVDAGLARATEANQSAQLRKALEQAYNALVASEQYCDHEPGACSCEDDRDRLLAEINAVLTSTAPEAAPSGRLEWVPVEDPAADGFVASPEEAAS